MSKPTILKALLTEAAAAPQATQMKLGDLVEPIRSHIAELFDSSVFHVTADGGPTALCDDVTIRFALEPKEQWPNGIWHNATNFLATIWPMGRGGRDIGSGLFKIELSMSGLPVKFVGRTGTGPTIIAHVKRFFDKVRESLDQTISSEATVTAIGGNRYYTWKGRFFLKDYNDHYQETTAKFIEELKSDAPPHSRLA